jgi:hypothetical protein
MKNKTFICEKSEGCRLADLNLNLSKGQKFSREIQVVETSRSIQAALKAGWIKEFDKETTGE